MKAPKSACEQLEMKTVDICFEEETKTIFFFNLATSKFQSFTCWLIHSTAEKLNQRKAAEASMKIK